MRRCSRHTARCEIRWARYDDAPYAADLPRNQARIRERTDAYREIESLLDEINIAIVQREFDAHVGVLVEERRHDGHHMAAAELYRRSDTQHAANRRLRGADQQLLVAGKPCARPFSQRAAGFGRRQPPSGAINQAQADAILQGTERACDGGRRSPQTPGGTDQTPGFNDWPEDGQFIQAVPRLFLFMEF